MPKELITAEGHGRTVQLDVRTVDVDSHSVLTEGERWEYLTHAIRDALTRILDEAKHDRSRV